MFSSPRHCLDLGTFNLDLGIYLPCKIETTDVSSGMRDFELRKIVTNVVSILHGRYEMALIAMSNVVQLRSSAQAANSQSWSQGAPELRSPGPQIIRSHLGLTARE